MAIKQYAAYQGLHTLANGAPGFAVDYLDRRGAEYLNKHLPRNHHHAVKCGWYFQRAEDRGDTSAAARTGPFTSSRKAYQAARAALETKGN